MDGFPAAHPHGLNERILLSGADPLARRASEGVKRPGQRGQDQCGQATKGMWGMSWRQKAMKGVEDCDKPGGMVKRVLIPGYPN
jgi:hypothetical protein